MTGALTAHPGPAGRRVEHDPTTLEIDLRHDRRDERDQCLSTVGQTQDQQVLGRARLQGGHLADLVTANGHGLEADKIPFVPAVLVIIILEDIAQEPDATQRFGPAPVLRVLEAKEENAVVVAGAAQHQRTSFRRLGPKTRTRREALAGGSCQNLHGHFTAKPVGLADTSDDNLHEPVPRVIAADPCRRCQPELADHPQGRPSPCEGHWQCARTDQ